MHVDTAPPSSGYIFSTGLDQHRSSNTENQMRHLVCLILLSILLSLYGIAATSQNGSPGRQRSNSSSPKRESIDRHPYAGPQQTVGSSSMKQKKPSLKSSSEEGREDRGPMREGRRVSFAELPPRAKISTMERRPRSQRGVFVLYQYVEPRETTEGSPRQQARPSSFTPGSTSSGGPSNSPSGGHTSQATGSGRHSTKSPSQCGFANKWAKCLLPRGDA
jgi:hypothetical protein